eukprot:2273067-Pleurochrysis_carterae.AAC.1
MRCGWWLRPRCARGWLIGAHVSKWYLRSYCDPAAYPWVGLPSHSCARAVTPACAPQLVVVHQLRRSEQGWMVGVALAV